MLSDKPTVTDCMNRRALVHEKARQIMSCAPPMTFGVHGDWGAGKTSFLKQLRYCLDPTVDVGGETPDKALALGEFSGSVITVWFEAWRYQNEPAPVIALLQEIRRQFTKWASLNNQAKKIAEVTTRSILNSLDNVAKLLRLEAVPFSPSAIQAAGERYERENLQEKLGVDSIQEFLESSIATVISSIAGENGRLVVFIDDLDRCNPEAAFRLLEGLKIYLGLDHCVFVIGMNQQLVIDSISSRLPRESPAITVGSAASAARIRAEAYLEKICISIERLVPSGSENELLCQWVQDEELSRIVGLALKSSGKAVRCLPPNPRRIKAIANLLVRWRSAMQLDKQQDEDSAIKSVRAILIVAYVYQFHSELIQRWHFNPAFFSSIQKWAVDPWSAGTITWPAYFSSLQLPTQHMSRDESEATPRPELVNNFPDPYASDVFWIAPLIRLEQFNEQYMQGVMSRVFGEHA